MTPTRRTVPINSVERSSVRQERRCDEGVSNEFFDHGLEGANRRLPPDELPR